MTRVAVLGSGAGGCAVAVDLATRGHLVRLWNRRPSTLGPLLDGAPISYAGALGTGQVVPALVTTDLDAALAGADVAVICLPALAHAALFAELADRAEPGDRESPAQALPLVLHPGHTCGALHARAVYGRQARRLPPLAELSTLAYVARKQGPDRLIVYSAAGKVRAAALPGGEAALEHASELFPACYLERDVLATSLANVNLVLHPPGAILAAAWVEATGGDFTFYVDAMTPGVGRVVSALDAERLRVARAFGHVLPSLLDEMEGIGTVEPDAAASGDYSTAIRSAAANSRIAAPGSLGHRYYREDLPFAVVPFVELGRIAGVETTVAEALLAVGEAATGERFRESGLTAERLGIAGYRSEELEHLVR